MNSPAIKLYSLSYKESRTYLIASAFVIGNVLFPQLCHLIPGGGTMFLPIYFFTLIAAYKYGWKAGLITAVLSPLLNNILFGMPMTASLPIIMFKSVLLATIAGYTAQRFNKVSLLLLACVVVSYQIIGGLAEWGYTGNISMALQDLSIGIPGMILQIAGGYLLIRYLLKR